MNAPAQLYYIAFSIHGTNKFIVATKRMTESVYDLHKQGFVRQPSRRNSYKPSDGIKLHWDKLTRMVDGKPYTNRAWVSRRFKELVAAGWTVVEDKHER